MGLADAGDCAADDAIDWARAGLQVRNWPACTTAAQSARPPASSCNGAWTWRPPGSASNPDILVPGFPAAPVRAGFSGSSPAVVAKDLLRGQGPAPERPGQAAMPELAGQGRRRDGHDGALGVGQAVAAHLGKGQPAQRAPAAGAHDQHIVRAAGPADRREPHPRLPSARPGVAGRPGPGTPSPARATTRPGGRGHRPAVPRR